MYIYICIQIVGWKKLCQSMYSHSNTFPKWYDCKRHGICEYNTYMCVELVKVNVILFQQKKNVFSSFISIYVSRIYGVQVGITIASWTKHKGFVNICKEP